MPAGIVLFAQAAPTWTDKELLIAIGSTIAAMVPIVVFAINFMIWTYKKRAKQAWAEVTRLREELQRGDAPASSALADLQQKLQDAQEEAGQLRTAHAVAADRGQSLTQTIGRLDGDLAAAKQDLAQHQTELAAERRRIQKALTKDGQTWTEKVRAGSPEFRPLDPEGRRTPIISVLNLKGGVGKTTITANLGAALDHLGYRVLLLDLDLQGSLTSLFLRETEQQELSGSRRLLEDFLEAAFDREHPHLTDYVRPILPAQASGLVPTADTLAYAETNLAIRWLLREGNVDPRFLLRRELHFKRVTNQYDVILLDCPPLVNVCCVNAVTASDYLLIPILPSSQATARVPVLLHRLREFRNNLNTELKVLGIVANRTHRSELTSDEENRLSGLGVQARDILGHDVPLFETFIRQSVEVRSAEDSHRPLGPEDSMFQPFLDLAREVTQHFPGFCHPNRSAAAKEAVS